MPVLLRVPWGGGKRPIDPSKLSPTLSENSWKMIAQASEEGIASTLWKVGDGIDIVLSGDYNGTVTMQIAGFDHDAMTSGGKAGITFLSKQVLGAVVMNKNTQCYDWTETDLYNEELPKIKASLPDALQKVMKTVLKSCTNCNNSGYDHVTEDDVFIPSLAEIVLKGGPYTSTIKNFPDDGVRYAIFGTLSDRRKDKISGGLCDWWIRTSHSNQFMYVAKDSSSGFVDMTYPNRAYGVCFGFCV